MRIRFSTISHYCRYYRTLDFSYTLKLTLKINDWLIYNLVVCNICIGLIYK